MTKEVALAARKFIASHLKERRQELNMSQQELGDLMGVKKAAISRMEAGIYAPNLDIFLSWTSNLKMYFFVEGKESKEEVAQMMRDRWGKISSN